MGNNGIVVGALKDAELNGLQTMAESMLDSIATIKAGRESVKGYLLRVNEDNDIEIIKEVNFRVRGGTYNLEQGKTKEVR
jgi:hypothetical protein